jgi:pimeloyl-ACP methyl ester carboxylesterase
MPPESLTVEQLVRDTVAVTNYLRERFGKEKIYLLGHSGGTFIGIQAAARAPGLFHAYIGMAQMVHQIESENRAYAYMIGEYGRLGDTRMLRRLERTPVAVGGVMTKRYHALRDAAMHGLGVGTMHAMRSVISGIFLPVMQCREYTLGEKLDLWRAKSFTRRLLWDLILSTDLADAVPELALPVYFCHGIHDYTVTYAETKAYFEGLRAPQKGFYTFTESAHSPLFEEPERMLKILVEDVLAGRNRLADGI